MPTMIAKSPGLKKLVAELGRKRRRCAGLIAQRDALEAEIDRLQSMEEMSGPHAFPKTKARRSPPVAGTLGIDPGDQLQVVRLVQEGFPFSRVAKFQRIAQLPPEVFARFVAIPRRTLSRRRKEGRLRADESDRVWRASTVFDRAIELFDGDTAAARRWLTAPQRALGGAVPLDFASTEVGAREVENLIGRLVHGVFT